MTPGVVHLGLGAFHRAHQALVFEMLQNQYGAQWGVFSFAMTNAALAEQLVSNDYRYHVRIGDVDGTRWHFCHAIRQVGVTAQDRQKVIGAIAAPCTRWVTLTVTEKGYTPALAQILVDGLRARWQSKQAGVTIASCDNLHQNGDRLRALCKAVCADQADLWTWVEACCTFPNSMVDRIVPATTPDLVQACAQATGVVDRAVVATEGFWEWVIEDRLAVPADAALLRGAGVQVVADVTPYELAKLNLLNGSHSALSCLGALLDLETVDQVMAQPDLKAWIEALMMQDLGFGLQREDWPAYAQSLVRRFANPTLAHRVHQICNDLSQKIAQRWQAPILRARGAGRMPVQLAMAAALAIRYWQGSSESGRTYTMQDPGSGDIHSQAAALAHDPRQAVQALGRMESLWGPRLSQDEAWLKTIEDSLQSIQKLGIRQALGRLLSV